MSHFCSILTPCCLSVPSQRAVNSREIALTSSLSTLYIIKASMLYLFLLPSRLRSFSVIHGTNCANHLGTSGLFTESCGEEGRCFSSVLDSSFDRWPLCPWLCILYFLDVLLNPLLVFLFASWFFLFGPYTFSLYIYIPMPANLFYIFWINNFFHYRSMKWSCFKKIVCFLQAGFPCSVGIVWIDALTIVSLECCKLSWILFSLRLFISTVRFLKYGFWKSIVFILLFSFFLFLWLVNYVVSWSFLPKLHSSCMI